MDEVEPLTTFGVTVRHDELSFRALHFAVHPGDVSEALHGHTYRVRVSAWGPLDDDGCVIDFGALRTVVRTVCAPINKRLLLPGNHPTLTIEADEAQLRVSHRQRSYAFPADEVLVLPIRNTTTELLARHVARAVFDGLREHAAVPPALEVSLAESEGQGATVRLNLWPAPLDVLV